MILTGAVGRVQKLGKYNRHQSVVTSRPLNTTLTNYNSRDKYNENIDVGSKVPITADAYSIPSNDENDALCLFLEYFLHLVAADIRIFEPLPPLHVGIIFSDVFGGVCGTA